MPSLTAPRIATLANILGEHATAWLLAVRPATVGLWRSGFALAAPDDSVLTELESLVASASAVSGSSGLQIAQLLGRYDSAQGVTVGAAMRLGAGGSIESRTMTHPLARSLAHLAAELEGALLLEPELLGSFANHAPMLAGALAHPEMQRASAAAVDIIPAPWFDDGIVIVRTSGTGTQMAAPEFLPMEFLAAATARWRSDPRWPDHDALMDGVTGVVDDIVRLVAGEQIHAPLLLGVSGVRLPEDASVELPWGVLRALRTAERPHIPEQIPDVVLECRLPLGTRPVRVDALNDADEMRWPHADVARRRVEQLAFVMQLAGLRVPASASTPGAQLIFDPLHGPPQLSWPVATHPIWQLEITPGQIAELERWAERQHRLSDRNVHIAIRRAVSASSRLDPTDGFIDAVIGWENLFGGSSEIALRLRASFARLLGSTPEERQQIAKQVSEDYTRRSKLLHGAAPVLPEREAVAARDRALELLLRAMRALFTTHTHLLRMESSARSSSLLIEE